MIKKIILVVAVVGAIAHSLIDPDFWLWSWFRNPSFDWISIVISLALLFFVSILYGAHKKSIGDEKTIVNENKQRSNLTVDQYRSDLWRGSFNAVVTDINADGQPTNVDLYPKPPDPVPTYRQRFKNNLTRSRPTDD